MKLLRIAIRVTMLSVTSFLCLSLSATAKNVSGLHEGHSHRTCGRQPQTGNVRAPGLKFFTIVGSGATATITTSGWIFPNLATTSLPEPRATVATPSNTQVPSFTFEQIDYPRALATRALGINAEGTIVGAFDDSETTHGFPLRDGAFIQLDFRCIVNAS